MSQLGPYYRDYRSVSAFHMTPALKTDMSSWRMDSSVLPPSERRFPLLGLDLLRLLAQDKIAQFHTVLESLVKESGRENVDIRAFEMPLYLKASCFLMIALPRLSAHESLHFASRQPGAVAHGGKLLEGLEGPDPRPDGGVPVLCRRACRYHPVRALLFAWHP